VWCVWCVKCVYMCVCMCVGSGVCGVSGVCMGVCGVGVTDLRTQTAVGGYIRTMGLG